MKRTVFALPIALVCLVLAGSTPSGQRRPSLSTDLQHHPKGPHTHRVIVQAEEQGLSSLRKGVLGLLRREVAGAVAIEVNDA